MRHKIFCRRPALWLFLVFAGIVLLSNAIYRHYGGYVPRQFVMGSDMEGYYQYLPHFFLKDWEEMDQMRWAKMYGEEKKLNVFTSGVAIMQTPFFLGAHVISKIRGLESDGYNPVYFMSVLYAALFYVYLGLFFLYKSLKRWFDKSSAFLVALLAFLATNLFYYTVMQPGMSHAYSFSLICIFIYYVPGFYEKPRPGNALPVIVPLALAVLIRPTNIIAGFYFLLYGVHSFTDLRQRLLFLGRKWYLLLFMFLIAVLVFFPQMVYWHHVTGKWFMYSYQQEGFSNFTSPEIFTVLFGARNGWFIYTPVMLIATGGLFYLVYKRQYSAPGILLIMILIIYMNASWWLPTFSAAAGYRTLIEYIPLMAIPLAYVAERSSRNKLTYRILLTVLILFMVYNVLFCFKYDGHLWWNTEWQWSYFLRLVRF